MTKRWYHSEDHFSPRLNKSSLGLFMHEVLKAGATIGQVWPFNHKYNTSSVYFTVEMTEEQKNLIESRTKFRFKDPPTIRLNSD